ncbi:MAG TPA: response regulator transcription factor [Candidatus Sulfotelmatobacter sp.]|jgi:two-component system response regulator NreC|nr:response regulator transcription factor [Candidatus Sulfotelmatobacter sp.]
MPFRILIVDDSYVIRHSLRGFIERSTDWEVCGEAENGKIALQKVTELRPNLVILDLSMPVMNGLEAARQITRLAPKVAMVMFTMHVSTQLRQDAQAAGIREVIAKSDGIEDHLFPAIRTIGASP